jgi:hypothetical protein
VGRTLVANTLLAGSAYGKRHRARPLNSVVRSRMQPLYRYLGPRHVDSFLREGSLLMRSLSYYRDYEDAGVRADPFEGTLAHRPKEGLKVTMVGSGEIRSLPHTLESTAREDDIFVYCVSSELNPETAKQFGTGVCIEIHKPVEFLHRLRTALSLRSRIRASALVHGDVRYYELHEPPIIDWALPERIALRKPRHFSWQHEYRFAVPRGNAFAVENVSVKLVPLGGSRPPRATSHPSIALKLGNLSRFCKVHHL